MNIKKSIFAGVAVAFVAVAVMVMPAQAQPPQGGPPGGGEHGPGGAHGPGGEHGPGGGGHPIIIALDADHNHELSADEISNASKVLKALDKNGDGKLNEEDLGRMGPPGGGPPGGGLGGRGGPGGRPGEGGTDSGSRASDFASRLMAFDKNDNGKIEKDELPARMQSVIANMDTNKDGVLDESELGDMKKQASSNSSAGRGNRRQGRGGAGAERGGRGGGGPDRGGRGGRGGQGGGPERMIDHAFEFDKDGDGKLSREELTAFAASMPQPGGGPPGMGGGPGGRGGPPAAGRRPGRDR